VDGERLDPRRVQKANPFTRSHALGYILTRLRRYGLKIQFPEMGAHSVSCYKH